MPPLVLHLDTLLSFLGDLRDLRSWFLGCRGFPLLLYASRGSVQVWPPPPVKPEGFRIEFVCWGGIPNLPYALPQRGYNFQHLPMPTAFGIEVPDEGGHDLHTPFREAVDLCLNNSICRKSLGYNSLRSWASKTPYTLRKGDGSLSQGLLTQRVSEFFVRAGRTRWMTLQMLTHEPQLGRAVYTDGMVVICGGKKFLILWTMYAVRRPEYRHRFFSVARRIDKRRNLL